MALIQSPNRTSMDTTARALFRWKKGVKDLAVALLRNEASGCFPTLVPRLVVDYFDKGKSIESNTYKIRGGRVETMPRVDWNWTH